MYSEFCRRSSTVLRTVFSADFETHVRSCPDCSDLVSDLKLIASEARQLAATEEPVAAGVGGDRRPIARGRPDSRSGIRAGPARSCSSLFTAPMERTVAGTGRAAMLLAAGAYVVNHKPSTPVAQKQTPEAPVTPAKTYNYRDYRGCFRSDSRSNSTAPVSEQATDWHQRLCTPRRDSRSRECRIRAQRQRGRPAIFECSFHACAVDAEHL